MTDTEIEILKDAIRKVKKFNDEKIEQQNHLIVKQFVGVNDIGKLNKMIIAVEKAYGVIQ